MGITEQFFASWFVHTAGLVVFFAVSVVAIGRFYEFFLGMKRKNDDFDELIYMVLMTVLIGSIFVFFVAHWVPSDDDF